MKVKTLFLPMADRYYFDFGKCKKMAQVDTKQDASYYGHWTDPFTMEIVGYVEGDVTVYTAENEEEYIEEIRKMSDWHKEKGYWYGIDPGWPESENCERLTAKFNDLGLSDLLH
jgi:hypothetical protein